MVEYNENSWLFLIGQKMTDNDLTSGREQIIL